MYLSLDIKKIMLAMARKNMSVTKLAEAYGVSRARINVILNQRRVSLPTAGRLAEALDVDVKELLVDD